MRATITAQEAAKYLNISYWLVLELVKRNELPAIRAGRRVLFRVAALDEWMNKQEAKVLQKPEEPGYGKIRRVL